MMRRGLASIFFAALLTVPALAQQPLVRGLELERQGRYEEAARQYRLVVESDPTNATGLIGLERVLPRLGQLDSLVPLVQRAVDSGASSDEVRALEIRMWVTLGDEDRAEAAGRRWIAASPDDDTAYREWARALLTRGQLTDARAVLEEGRSAAGGPPALADEIARVAVMLGDWETAALEWRQAVDMEAKSLATAEANLGLVPAEERRGVVRLLSDDGNRAGSQLAADLLAIWGDPEEAWVILTRALPPDANGQREWLARFAERVRRDRGQEARRVYGLTLERLADVAPPAEASRHRADAARAFSSAGDVKAARRMLEKIAADRGAPPSVSAIAQATLIELLAAEGKMDQAHQRFAEWTESLPGEERAQLLSDLVWGWLRKGELEQARLLVMADSSLATMALRGWVALFSGHLTEAVQAFRAAGPRAGDRATERTQMLALVQPIERDSLPGLGAALLTLTQGDTSRAVRQLKEAGSSLSAGPGRGGVLAFAANLEVAIGKTREAEETYRAVLAIRGAGAALPAAGLGLARLLLRRGARTEAIEQLEELILTYPASALVPQARRELDRARGAIPRRS